MPCSAKIFNVLIIVFICLNFTVAQNQVTIDSLIRVVESDISQKEKVDIYVKIAKEYSRLDSVNTKKYVDKAINLAKAIPYPEGEIDALSELGINKLIIGNYPEVENIFKNIIKKTDEIAYLTGKGKGFNGLGNLYWVKGNFELALENHFKALEIREKIGNKLAISTSLNNIGAVYFAQSNHEKALKYYFEALEIREKLGTKKNLISSSYNNIAIIFSVQGNYSKALEYYYLALKINEETDDKLRISSNLNNIGNIYFTQEDYGKALECYSKSLKINQNISNVSRVAGNYGNIGTVYQKMNDYDKALDYYFKGLKIHENLQDKENIAVSFNYIASIFEETGNLEEGIDYSLKAIEISDEIGVINDKINALLILGKIYRKQGEWGLARKNLKECFKYARETGYSEELRDATEELALLESSVGNYKVAYEYQLFFKQMADSLQNEDLTKKITRLEMDYEFEQEKDSIQFANATERIALEKDIEKRELVQLSTSVVLVLVLLLTFLLFIFFREKKYANKLLSEKSTKLEEANKSLSESNFEILQQAENISLLNELLEKNLDEASKDLLVKNQKLAEYAFYNSHRTRAPLARVLGLIQLLDTKKVDADTTNLLELILHCIKDLDKTIIKMNDILSDVDITDDNEITDTGESENF